jgi:hypothetical protein
MKRRNLLHGDMKDPVRQLDQINDEVVALRSRIEQIRPDETIRHPDRRRKERPYCVERRAPG